MKRLGREGLGSGKQPFQLTILFDLKLDFFRPNLNFLRMSQQPKRQVDQR